MPVRLGARHPARAHGTTAARTVVHDHGLPRMPGQRNAQRAGHDVHVAARRKGHDQRERLGRKCARLHCRCSRCRSQRRERYRRADKASAARFRPPYDPVRIGLHQGMCNGSHGRVHGRCRCRYPVGARELHPGPAFLHQRLQVAAARPAGAQLARRVAEAGDGDPARKQRIAPSAAHAQGVQRFDLRLRRVLVDHGHATHAARFGMAQRLLEKAVVATIHAGLD
ncbi:hypothetical protein COLO4_02636 [Corchorus olitorius]|uniref:Uncharacterized protein n=1 Tax=Corchorus olitorius TaxID=93759 RepID=A0A1R3L0N1_9ROSI|nr:hypothetical protein COLO4_02636 [Corchorus olitorius]